MPRTRKPKAPDVPDAILDHFARQGPLGVVRSGSLVAVHPRHPRTLRVIRPERPRAAPLLEEAA